MKKYDLIIIGAGAAGLRCAAAAINNGRSVAVFDMGDAPARKVRVSGGGRCNFTNMAVCRDRYFGENPDFVRSAIARVKPSDILDWARSHNLRWEEKAPGQFFCGMGADAIVNALIADATGAEIIFNTNIVDIKKSGDAFIVRSDDDEFSSKSVAITTGGVSYPALGVSDFGYKVAMSFGHKVIPTTPGLVALNTDIFPREFAGISLPVKISIGKSSVSDSLLFTHFGIGGPAAYRASLFEINKEIKIDFLPKINLGDWLVSNKKAEGKKTLQRLLSVYLPSKLARWFTGDAPYNLADYRDADLIDLGNIINNFIIPDGDVKRAGLERAEVVSGGVSTDEISSKTMESKLCPGLYFAGEVLDITGDLGGFNLHWAFSSGTVAGTNA